MSRTALDPVQGLVTWTPTWANVTMGSSTSTGWYVRLAQRWIVFEAVLTTASGFAFTGNPRCNLPVPAHGGWVIGPQFNGKAYSSGGTKCPLFFDQNGDANNAPYPVAMNQTGTYSVWAYVSSTVPFNWGTSGDQLIVHGRYPAASIL